MAREPQPFVPSLAVEALMARLFDGIQIDQRWVDQVRALSKEGTVVYVLRNQSLVDFMALAHLVKRHRLPPIYFAHDVGPWWTDPVGAWLGTSAVEPRDTPARALRSTLEAGRSAVLFLKRPPGPLDLAAGASGTRGLSESEELTHAVFDAQRQQERPIFLVPEVFVWTKRGDTRGTSPLDFLFGPAEWPTTPRAVAQFLVNMRYVSLRSGEPVRVGEFLEETDALADGARTRRLTYMLLRRLERERRAILGPAGKPPDRIRAEIVRSPKLQSTIEDLAGGSPAERYELTARALKLLEELQATLDMATVKGFDVLLRNLFGQLYAGVEYDRDGLAHVREAARNGTLIVLPSHKSHIDYLVISYVFYRENISVPLIAAGDNLNFFPVGGLLRRGGAFFIRRSFRGDRLYAAVVEAYLRRLLRDGQALEVFLEGGRSRSGKLLPPKLGLLNMIVEGALAVPHRPVHFVPVSIGYERVVEMGSFERELLGGEKEPEDAAGLLRSSSVLRHRYGRIRLEFGAIQTLKGIREELKLPPQGALSPAKRRAVVTRLGNRVMDEINSVTAVTPGPLTALALLAGHQREIPHGDLVAACSRLLRVLQAEGARIAPALMNSTGTVRPTAIRDAARLFVDLSSVEARDGTAPTWSPLPRRRAPDDDAIYTVPPSRRLALDVSKNMIVHFFVERGLLALALLRGQPAGAAKESPGTPASVALERVEDLSRWFKYEFRFRPESLHVTFDATLGRMVAHGEVSSADGVLTPGDGHDGWDGAEWLRVHGTILAAFVEGYALTVRALDVLLDRHLTEKELTKRVLTNGRRLFGQGSVERAEAVNKPVVENALSALVDRGVLRRRDGKLELAAMVRSQAAIDEVAEQLEAYLHPLRAS